MATYRDLAAVAEFRSLFAGRTAVSAAGTMQMLAMAVLVYSGTGSPLLAALAFLAGSLPQVVGAMTLRSRTGCHRGGCWRAGSCCAHSPSRCWHSACCRSGRRWCC